MGSGKRFTFYEFFAGGGMARCGLGERWSCRFANDFDEAKAEAYRANWGADEFRLGDVRKLTTDDLPGAVDLAWASFPCQDLSLAGAGAGLKGARSGSFWPFWRLMKDLHAERRAPALIVLENVCGALTSHGGKDFAALAGALAEGYRFGAVVIDAQHFTPQSRPRLFILAVRRDVGINGEFVGNGPGAVWHPRALVDAQRRLPAGLRKNWVWWRLPSPPHRNTALADVIDAGADDWDDAARTQRLLALMNPLHRRKLAEFRGGRAVGAVYRRTRRDAEGQRVQRAEVRFDGLAGCLRTPAGGSSRQTILVVDGDTIRSRLLSAREAARLMGLPEEYELPGSYTGAYALAGDGVVAPVVRFLAESLLEPILSR